MKYTLITSAILGVATIATPAHAQFSSFPTGSDSCSNVCVKVDVGSANNDSSFGSGFNNGFSNSGDASNSGKNIKWQVGVIWKPNAPEVAQAEGERTKQKLEDNRSLMTSLADAIAQNKTELASGLAILLAPRLGYSDPRKLIADLKEGSIPKLAQTAIETKQEIPKVPTVDVAPTTIIELR
jgi:hypothetical protein